MVEPALDLRSQPRSIRVYVEGTFLELAREGEVWSQAGVSVWIHGDIVSLRAPNLPVKAVEIAWEGTPAYTSVLGDHWERSYGDLAWRPPDATRPLPWYFLARIGPRTHGYGVAVGPSAIVSWRASGRSITLHADVRNGGSGVKLGDRTLDIAKLVYAESIEGESAFDFARRFCHKMCPKPRTLNHRVYGANDWYYAYGDNTAERILHDTEFLVKNSPTTNRPYSVIDAGWQPLGGSDAGPWDDGNARFGSMPELAHKMADLGARPGIWVRPLAVYKDAPAAWRLKWRPAYLDPTIPEALAQVATDVKRLHDWGYQLIKHDFTTWDVCGKWGFEMKDAMTDDGWSFADRSVTTAEAITRLYRMIRDAAGDSAIIGCNTIGHLSAGLFEISRIGDDTSGKEWDRTKKMGVNALAFRACQHETFFQADADCVGLAKAEAIPWDKNRQWLDLVARSGTPLFISFRRELLTAGQVADVKEALTQAAERVSVGEPIDWFDTPTPEHWRLLGETKSYAW